MKKDDMIMKMGIVHILDSVVGMPVLSDCPIDMGSNLCDFLKAHIEKIYRERRYEGLPVF